MTPDEWQQSNDPMNMLRGIQDRADNTRMANRKLRLIAVAFARRILHMVDDRSKVAIVEVAEQFADGLLPIGLLAEFYDKADLNWQTIGSVPSQWAAKDYALGAIGDAVNPNSYKAADNTRLLVQLALHSASEVSPFGEPIAITPEHSFQTHILHDVADDLFFGFRFESKWQTDTVLSLAQLVYETGEFDKMPILADALENAGCDSIAILNHCRHLAPHVRGCWVVDLLLGKK